MYEIAFSLFLIGNFLQIASGDAIISVKFVSFSNHQGLGRNGHCCDGKFGFCFSACDHRFIVCLDRYEGNSRDIRSCSFGKFVSREITDANYINFKDTFGGVANPMLWRTDYWPMQARLKVDIVDVDPRNNDDDDVDFLQSVFLLLPNEPAKRITLHNRVYLTVEARVYCGQNYYGMNCDKYCYQRDDYLGHYTCNKVNGSKICTSGWTGPNCNINENNCVGITCQNGGLCQDLINSFQCNCRTGFKGNLCEQDINECLQPNVCSHGVCINIPGSFMCKCYNGYTGVTCGININDCLPSPCQNNAICTDLIGEFQCTCSTGFTGKVCDTDIDECQLDPCKNNGTCINNPGGYRCDCLTGYRGSDCALDIDECDRFPCKNGAMCKNFNGGYTCQCKGGFEGSHCEIDIDECRNASAVCENGGICTNEFGSFKCHCPSAYTGIICETDINECLSNPCKHESVCNNLPGGYTCNCQEGYTDVSIPFYLACQISPKTEWAIDKGLMRLFLDTRLFQGRKLAVNHRSETETSTKGQVVTSIYPVVTVDGKLLSDHEVAYVINMVSHKIEEYLHCSIFHDAIQGKLSYSASTLNSDTPDWYPGLITAGAVLLVAVILAVIIGSRRRIKSWYQNKTKDTHEISVVNPLYVSMDAASESIICKTVWNIEEDKLNSTQDYDVPDGQPSSGLDQPILQTFSHI